MRARSLLVVPSLALLVTPLATSGAGGQERVGPPTVEAARQVTVESEPNRLFVSPVVAVHPDEPRTMAVATGDARNGGCTVRVSRDGGLSWGESQNIVPRPFTHCVQRNFGTVMGLAFGPDGSLHAALSASSVADGHPNGPIAAVAAKSTDLGQTWETKVVAQPKPYSEGQVQGFEQHGVMSMAVDPNNADLVYMGWRGRVLDQATLAAVPALAERPYVSVSRDGGRTWGQPTDVLKSIDDGKLFGAGTPTFAVGPKGEAYAFIRERPDRPPAPAPRPAQRLFMIKSVDQGRTWSSALVYPGQVFIYQPVPAIDPKGNISLVWFQAEGQTLDTPTQIRFTTSKDGGKTWSEPVELTDDDPAGKFNQYWPGMSVAPNGRIDVAWHDFRGDPYYVPSGVGPMGLGSTSQQFSNIYYTYSNDGGKTWAPNVRVSDRSIYRRVGITFNNQDVVGPVGMASTNEGVVITWADSRGSGPFDAEDAYVTRVRFDDGTLAGAAGEDDDESPLVWGTMGAGVALGVAGALFAVAARAVRRPKETPAPA